MRRGDDSTDAGRQDKRGDPRGEPEAAPAAATPEVTFVFSRRAIRELDRLAVEQYGMPAMLLMENAAIGLAGGVAEMMPSEADGGGGGGGVLILAGRGNNGGDGLAAARHLHNEGRRVAVVLAAPEEEFAGDAAVHLGIVKRMKIPVYVATAEDPRKAVHAAVAELGGAHVIVDALLGTGLKGAVTGAYAGLIAAANALRADAGAVVVAADLPSGLDADSGEPQGEGNDPAVRADMTVTFSGLKEGFLTLGAQEFLGEVVVSPIGAPMELTRRLGRPVPVSEHPGDRPGEGPARPRRKPPPPAPRTH